MRFGNDRASVKSMAACGVMSAGSRIHPVHKAPIMKRIWNNVSKQVELASKYQTTQSSQSLPRISISWSISNYAILAFKDPLRLSVCLKLSLRP
jgi:hypothetical protein